MDLKIKFGNGDWVHLTRYQVVARYVSQALVYMLMDLQVL
jgi:hypothetical protein